MSRCMRFMTLPAAVAVLLLAVPATAPAAAPAPASGSAVPSASTRTTPPSLALRASATGGKVLTRLRRGTAVTVECQRNGALASGPTGATRIWARVRTSTGRRGYVADPYLDTRTTALVAPYCGVGAAGPTAGAPAGQGRCGPVSPFTLIPPFAQPDQFIVAAVPAAQASRAQYRVPVSVTLAQGILETGFGKVAALANNYFGLKAQNVTPGRVWSWEDLAGGCVFKKTWEVRSGRLATEIAAFRAYATLDASFLDHGRRLATNPVYAAAFRHTGDPTRFAREIARRWATDPSYATKLLDLMKRYELRQYDD